MPAKRKALVRSEVPDFDCRVNRATCEDVRVETETNDAFLMALENAETLPGTPIPDTHSMVHAAGNQLGLVELESADWSSMSRETVDLLPGVEVPHASGVVVGTSDKDGECWMRQCFRELKTHDTVGMSLQRPYGTSSATPIPFDGESFAIDIFPWPSE